MDYDLVKVKNRTGQDIELMWDGRLHFFPAGKAVACLRDAANHCVRKSMAQWDPATGSCVYRLGIVGEHDVSSLDVSVDANTELLDRSGDADAEKFGNVAVKDSKGGQQAFLGPQAVMQPTAVPAGGAVKEEWEDESIKDSSS
ncbi:hypothetical protein [Caudoviricetes sp.]|nr:hypothetical protein [Caudoviricetes sp.]